MADELSEEELEAIESYDGPVHKIARGRSGVPVNSVAWLEGNKSHFRKYNRIQKFVISKERDDTIREMVKSHSTISEMSRVTGLPRKSVKARIERMKLDY